MLIASILALIFGLLFILFPGPLNTAYGVTLQEGGEWVGRYLGSAFLGFAVLNWLGRSAHESEGKRAILLAGFVTAVTGLAVALFNAIFGSGNAFVWLNVVIYLFLAVGYGYFHFGKRAES
jgi:hypothetical protein